MQPLPAAKLPISLHSPDAPRRRARAESKLTRSMREKGYLLCTEVAQRVGIHKATVYRWIRDGRVRVKDFSGAYYVEWVSVVEHLGEIAGVLELTEELGAKETLDGGDVAAPPA